MLGCGVTSAIHRVASTSLASTFLEEALDGRHDPGPLAVERSRCRSEYVSLFVCGMQTPLPRRGLATAVDEKAAPEALLPGRGRQFAGSDLCPLDALGCERMRAQKCEHRNFAALQLLQRREKPHHAYGSYPAAAARRWPSPSASCSSSRLQPRCKSSVPTRAAVCRSRSSSEGVPNTSCRSNATPRRRPSVFMPCLRSTCAISWPMTLATTSESCPTTSSRAVVRKTWPPGAANALTA